MIRDPKNPNDLRKGQEDHAADPLRYGVMAVYDPPATMTVRPLEQEIDPSKQDATFEKMMKQLRKDRSKAGADYAQLGTW